jgi:hypothetical protein
MRRLGLAVLLCASPAQAAQADAAAPGVWLDTAPAAATAAPVGPVTVRAKAAATEVAVGQVFTVEVEARGPAGTTYTFPPEVADDTADLVAWADAPSLPHKATYNASVFVLKDAAVPPIAVTYRLPDGTTGQVTTAPIPVTIKSLLPRDPKERQLADIRPPMDIPAFPREFWLTLLRALTHSAVGLLALAAAAALAYWLWRKRRKRKAAEAAVATRQVPAVPPDVEALGALDNLAASGRIEREGFRPFYITLTEIAKRYLERRLQAPILEMTTAEMLACLRRHPHGNAFVDLMSDVSTAADRIKFARGAGARERAESHLGAVRRLVVDMEARLRPVYVEPPPAAGRKAS